MVEVETCGVQTHVLFVDNDITKITVDGKEYTLSSPTEKQEEEAKTGTLITLEDRKGGNGYTLWIEKGIITSDSGEYRVGVYRILDKHGNKIGLIDTDHLGNFTLR